MKAEDLTIDKINLNDTFSFEKAWSKDEVDDFAKLSGDYNPLHTDETYASNTHFKKRVVHGALVVSSFSKLIGMHLPGEKCLLISEQFLFKEPVFIDEKLTISGTVIDKSISTSILEIKVTATKNNTIAVEGKIKVIVRKN